MFADAAVAQAAKSSGGGYGSSYSLSQVVQDRLRLVGPLLLVGFKPADAAAAAKLLGQAWSGPAAVLLNAAPPAPSAPELDAYRSLVESFDMVWCFLPVAIKGLLGSKEGAVLRRGTSADAKWVILQQERGQWLQVGQSRTRPGNEELELAFLNASAASSPLTAAARFVRGVVDKVNKPPTAGGGKQ